jgi:hypothetical protein
MKMSSRGKTKTNMMKAKTGMSMKTMARKTRETREKEKAKAKAKAKAGPLLKMAKPTLSAELSRDPSHGFRQRRMLYFQK